jgi:hypothetical protein
MGKQKLSRRALTCRNERSGVMLLIFCESVSFQNRPKYGAMKYFGDVTRHKTTRTRKESLVCLPRKFRLKRMMLMIFGGQLSNSMRNQSLFLSRLFSHGCSGVKFNLDFSFQPKWRSPS